MTHPPFDLGCADPKRPLAIHKDDIKFSGWSLLFCDTCGIQRRFAATADGFPVQRGYEQECTTHDIAVVDNYSYQSFKILFC